MVLFNGSLGFKIIEIPWFGHGQKPEKERPAVTTVMVLLAVLGTALLILYITGESEDKASASFAPFTAIITIPSLTVISAIGADGFTRTIAALLAGIFASLITWKATKITVDWLRPLLILIAICAIVIVAILGATKQNPERRHPGFEFPVK